MLKEKLNKVSSKFLEFSRKLESLISEYREYSEEQLLVDEKDDGGSIDKDKKQEKSKDSPKEDLFDEYGYPEDENHSDGSISEERVNIDDDVDFIKTEESTDKSYPCDKSKFLAKATTDLKTHMTRNKSAQDLKGIIETLDQNLTDIKETSDQNLEDIIDEDLTDIVEDMEDLSSDAIDQILSAEVKQEMTVLEKSQYQKVAGEGYLCNECPVKHRTMVEIKRHVKIHGEIKQSCPRCDYSGAYLKSHILRTHESHKMKDIKCTQCDFVTKFSTYLKRHKERVHNKTGVPHFCTELDCDFQTTLTEHLRRHIDRMHKIAASPCDKCEYVAKNPFELKTHKKSHNLLQCDQCSYSTVGTNYIGFKSHLEQHQAAEEGVKYSCTQCDHIANSQHLLNCHVYRSHSRTFNFCDQCDFKTKRKDRFRDHMNKHKGLLLHCERDQCAFSTPMRLSMKQHVNKVHNKPVIKCDQCDYSTDRTFYLKNHKKKRHADN